MSTVVKGGYGPITSMRPGHARTRRADDALPLWLSVAIGYLLSSGSYWRDARQSGAGLEVSNALFRIRGQGDSSPQQFRLDHRHGFLVVR